jgi:polyphenol oxidase
MFPPADWAVARWPAPAPVRTLITTRSGGVSNAPYDSMNLGLRVGDDENAVRQNRARLRACLPQEPRWLKQVHGARVVAASEALQEPEADGCVARAAGEVCVVLAADCLPVLLCDLEGQAVAAAHAGWRGLSAGVLEAAVAAMRVPAASILAYLGPAIGPQAFEVGADVLDAFSRDDPAHTCFTPTAPSASGEAKWLADLPGLARRRLARAGVSAVFSDPSCTYSEPARYYSHRRDRVSGRQGALIWLEP